MVLRDTVLRTVRTVRTVLRGWCCAIPCCGQCWCEDVAARYRAADGAGVRMVLRDTVVLWCEDVAARYRAADGVGVRMCEDVAARYRAADAADGAGVRMLLRDTVLQTVRTVLV